MQTEHRQCIQDDKANHADWLTLDYSLQLTSPQALKIDLDHASLLAEECQDNCVNSSQDLSLLQGLRVLIVDGDVDTLDIFSFVLQGKEAEVFGTTSTTEAIDKATTWYPNVLICDISLPGQDGYALVHELRSLQTDPNKFLSAIAVTTLLKQQDCLKLLSKSFQSESFQKYLPKPTDIYDLVAAVAELARLQTQINGAKPMAQMPEPYIHQIKNRVGLSAQCSPLLLPAQLTVRTWFCVVQPEFLIQRKVRADRRF